MLRCLLLLPGLLISFFPALAQLPLDLTRSVVFCPANATRPEQKAAQMLVEEVQKRTRIRLAQATQWPAGNVPIIAVGQAATLKKTGRKIPVSEAKPDGFQVKTDNSGAQPVIWVQGNDPRGTVFGAGWLLRQLTLVRDSVFLDKVLSMSTAPQTALRGHQLGYRPKPNSYDAWDLAQWEQYIRDLAVFGTNTIELIPPRSDDALDSPHFPLPPMETMIGMSRIADEYGLDVSVWYPAIDQDYGDPATMQAALKEWGTVLSQLPRLNAVFVPSGDPGTTPPDLLIRLLEKQAAQLKQYHPKATWWVSTQGFSVERVSRFRELIGKYPNWLAGTSYAPWTRMTAAAFRQWTPDRYLIRNYPDITHSHRCQYPVPDWDYSFVITQHREPINPRPLDMVKIFRYGASHSMGYITYSEGCNDDVNKIIWSALGWNAQQPVEQILQEYSRYFIGEAYTNSFSEGLLALERNWRGPILSNAGIDSTLAHFQRLEREAKPSLLLNWRFQQALFRAYYDAYLRQRRQYESKLETEALSLLTDAPRLGATNAMRQATAQLTKVETEPVAMPLKIRLLELGEALFQSIRMQLYLKRHLAGRSDGAMLERLDTPLNNRPYLLQRFGQITALATEPDQVKQLQELVSELRPSSQQPGMMYDDLGNPGHQPHLVRTMSYEKDPNFLESPMIINEQRAPGTTRYPLSWYSHVMGLYQQPIKLHYEGLEATARYKVRVVYASGPVRLVANQTTEIHPLLKKEFQLLEYDLPPETTRSGSLDLWWTGDPSAGESGRGNQVSEVWLIKQ